MRCAQLPPSVRSGPEGWSAELERLLSRRPLPVAARNQGQGRAPGELGFYEHGGSLRPRDGLDNSLHTKPDPCAAEAWDRMRAKWDHAPHRSRRSSWAGSRMQPKSTRASSRARDLASMRQSCVHWTRGVHAGSLPLSDGTWTTRGWIPGVCRYVAASPWPPRGFPGGRIPARAPDPADEAAAVAPARSVPCP